MWMVIASGISAVVAVAALRRWRTADPANLGYVTERWLMDTAPTRPPIHARPNRPRNLALLDTRGASCEHVTPRGTPRLCREVVAPWPKRQNPGKSPAPSANDDFLEAAGIARQVGTIGRPASSSLRVTLAPVSC